MSVARLSSISITGVTEFLARGASFGAGMVAYTTNLLNHRKIGGDLFATRELVAELVPPPDPYIERAETMGKVVKYMSLKVQENVFLQPIRQDDLGVLGNNLYNSIIIFFLIAMVYLLFNSYKRSSSR